MKQPRGSASTSPEQTSELLNTRVILPSDSSGLLAQLASLLICVLTQSLGLNNNHILVTASHCLFSLPLFFSIINTLTQKNTLFDTCFSVLLSETDARQGTESRRSKNENRKDQGENSPRILQVQGIYNIHHKSLLKCCFSYLWRLEDLWKCTSEHWT